MNRKVLWGLICTATAVGAVWYGRTKNLDPVAWAAWVQAIGSVLAILVAVAVADYHVRSERAVRAEQQKSLTKRVAAAVRNLGLAAHTLRTLVRESGTIDKAFLDRFRPYLLAREDAVLGVPIWSVEDAGAVVHLLVIHSFIADTRHLREVKPDGLEHQLDTMLVRCRAYLTEFGEPADLKVLSDEVDEQVGSK